MAKIDKTKVITNLVRFSYLKVFQPGKEGDIDAGKYSVSLIIPKSDKETIKYIKEAINAAKEDGKSVKWGGKIPAKMLEVLRDGDERDSDPAYEDSFYVNAKSTTKPGLIDINKNPITSEEELYSGCYGRASITFYPYDSNGNRGVACSLNNLQKIKDGEPLSGRASADSDFDDEFDDEDEDWD